MRKILSSLAAASIVVMPVQATAAAYDQIHVRPGAFVGARFQMGLGGKSSGEARAAIALSPTRSVTSDGAVLKTGIGEGIALNLGAKPSLTLAGKRPGQALGLGPSNGVDPQRKQGLSKGGWIALGIGVIALGAAVYGLAIYDEAKDNSD